MGPALRLAIGALTRPGATLHVVVGVDDDEDREAKDPPRGRPGTGLILHDLVGVPFPLRVGRRTVARLRALGVARDGAATAEVVRPEDRARLRALLDGRDVLWVASPGADPSPATPAPGPGAEAERSVTMSAAELRRRLHAQFVRRGTFPAEGTVHDWAAAVATGLSPGPERDLAFPPDPPPERPF